MKRLIAAVILLSLVVLSVSAFTARGRYEAYYTNAERIKEPAATAQLRDVLWEPAEHLGELINTASNDYEPRLSADGLTLYFVRGKAGHDADVYLCRATQDGWTEPRALAGVNTEYDELGPEPSRDGERLYFYSDRPGGFGEYDIWVVHRRSDDAGAFGEPVNLGPLVNSEFNDYGPAVAPDDTVLYFSSNRPKLDDTEQPDPEAWPATLREDIYSHDYDIYASDITELGAALAVPVEILNSPSDEGAPAVSSFGDFLYFASNRTGGFGGFDLYRARRLRGEHRPPSNLGAAVNSPANDLDPAMSLGGFALHFSSDRDAEAETSGATNDYDLYFTTSREVFREVETIRSSFDWPGLWAELGPNLLWALLLLLLLLLLLALLRSAAQGQLSLLAKCLLASLLTHLVLMLLLSLWGVTASIASALNSRGGSIQVALTPSAAADEIAGQIQASFASVESPPPIEMTRERAAWAMDPPTEVRPTRMEVLRTEVHSPSSDDLHDAPQEAAIVPPQDVPAVSVEAADTAEAKLAVAMPEQPQPAAASEPHARTPEHLRRPPRGERAKMAAVLPPRKSISLEAIAPAPGPVTDSQSRRESPLAKGAPVESELPQAALGITALDTTLDATPPADASASLQPTPPPLAAPMPSVSEPAQEKPPPQINAAERRRGPMTAALPQADLARAIVRVDPTARNVESNERLESVLSEHVNDARVTDATPPLSTTMPDTRTTPIPVAVPKVRAHQAAPEPEQDAHASLPESPRADVSPDVTVHTPQVAAALVEPQRPAGDAAPQRLLDTSSVLLPAEERHATIASNAAERLASMAPAPLSLPGVQADPAKATARHQPRDAELSVDAAMTPLPRSPLERTLAMDAPDGGGLIAIEPTAKATFEDPRRRADRAWAAPVDAVAPAASPAVHAAASLVPEPPAFGLRLPVESAPPTDEFEHRDDENRRTLLERMGGSDETERAVARALEWLAQHQNADGGWYGRSFDDGCGQCGGETHVEIDIGLTGLATLCFLGANHTHSDNGPYRTTVDRALSWLLQRQQPDGDLRGAETMYSHGIATIALSEAYGMTGDASLADPVRRAVAFIINARNADEGGWRYDPGQPGDTSVLGWQVMAMKSARMAGVDVPDGPLVTARRWLDRVHDPRRPGYYAYQPGQRYTLAMTAEATFVQQILGLDRGDARMRGAIRRIMDHLPDWRVELNTYYWYYATLAMFQHGGEPWREWNDQLKRELLAAQRTDGAARGSWDPEGKWARTGGRVYQTALGALMLEVYYRYLPMYSREETTPLPPVEIGAMFGLVTDAETGAALEGATVRIDRSDEPALHTTTSTQGRFKLRPGAVPDHFAVSASLDGYVPQSADVRGDALSGSTVRLDFALTPVHSDVIAIEAVPDVHHLGNDAFTGRINSQFQKKSEGDRYSARFTLSAGHARNEGYHAELRLLAKGVQCPHDIRINGHEIEARLDEAPRDGSFGEFRASFDAALLTPGANTIEIVATSCRGDLDDFEFVNLQIHLTR